MVALVSLPNPFATFISYKYKAHKQPTKTLIQCATRLPSSFSRRKRRKNYLRPKILKTLIKPYNIPSEEPIVDSIQPIETDVEVPIESVTGVLDSSLVEESEMTLSLDESGLRQLEVVRGTEGRELGRFNGFSGRTVVKIVGSFVGLFILQSVVAAWIKGSGKSDEKNGDLSIEDRKRNLRIKMQVGKVGVNGNALLGDLTGVDVDESEMIAKISEIRKMATEVREAEKKKRVENGKADMEDVSDDDDGNEDIESDHSRINGGIVKEVDGRLSKLSKTFPVSSMNVNFMNIIGGPGKEGKDEGLNGKEEDSMLFYKRKQKFRSKLTTPKDKPKGFQSTTDVRGKLDNVDAGNGRIGSGNDVKQSLNIDGAVPGKRDDAVGKEEKIPVSQSSEPLEGSRKSSGSSSAKKKVDKKINGFAASGSNGTGTKLSKESSDDIKPESGLRSLESNGTAKQLSKGKNESSRPERGLVQEPSNGNILDEEAGAKNSSTMSTPDKQKMNDYVASASSETLSKPKRKGQLRSNRRGSKLPQSTNKDDKINVDPWWSKLPYVLVILMQKGTGDEAERGFYNITMDSVADSQPNLSYTVAFEDQNDAQNFSYLLESTFEDLPDTAVDVAPLSKKDFKEVVETLEHKVIVVRKGELKLYAGQPLADAEAALRSLK